MKKCGSHVGELDQKLQLKTVIRHGDHICEIHVPWLVGFVAAKKDVG